MHVFKPLSLGYCEERLRNGCLHSEGVTLASRAVAYRTPTCEAYERIAWSAVVLIPRLWSRESFPRFLHGNFAGASREAEFICKGTDTYSLTRLHREIQTNSYVGYHATGTAPYLRMRFVAEA
jgi:hypothetical protein